MSTPWAVTRILAATDLSHASLPALRYARLFADAFAANLSVVYRDPLIYPMETVGPSQAMFVMPPPEHEARLRKEVVQHAGQVMTGRQYDIDLAVGQPVPAILEAAEQRDVDLIVTGAHLHERWRRFLFGSVSDGVQHASRCPVLTVSGDGPPLLDADVRISQILCPVNFTEIARESLAAAGQLARTFRARLFVVNVIESGEVKGTADDEERIREWIGPELQATCTYRELVLRGAPVDRVLDCAEDIGANLLVIGAQHKRFRDATVIGTTTERLIRFASCPVLVVPRLPVTKEVSHENRPERTDREHRRRDAGRAHAV